MKCSFKKNDLTSAIYIIFLNFIEHKKKNILFFNSADQHRSTGDAQPLPEPGQQRRRGQPLPAPDDDQWRRCGGDYRRRPGALQRRAVRQHQFAC